MKEILDFLAKNPAFFIATIDEKNQPRVRPFGLVMEWNNKLTFGTSTEKNVYKQLQKNPSVEICSFSPTTGEWMRISGKVAFTNDISAKKKVFEVMPDLKKIYQSEENPTLACFYIEEGEAAIYSFASMNAPTKVIKF